MKVTKRLSFLTPLAVALALVSTVTLFVFLQPLLGFIQNDDFKISTDVDLVLLDVSVKNAKGGYVVDLSKDDFKIEENGVRQKIVSFTSMDVPVAAGLILDASGSMQVKRPGVNLAGLAFVDASNPRDQIFVLDFNDKVLPGLPEGVTFTDDIGLLRTALSRHRIEGRTVLYDAITDGLKYLESAQRDKKTLVVVSDGGDNASSHNLAQLMQAIEASHATVYTVGIYDADDPDNNPGVLRHIANISGGECFLLQNYADIVPTSRKIADDIRKRYTIGYIPSAESGRGGTRRIKVTATSPDHGHLIAHTRTSYINPGLQ